MGCRRAAVASARVLRLRGQASTNSPHPPDLLRCYSCRNVGRHAEIRTGWPRRALFARFPEFLAAGSSPRKRHFTAVHGRVRADGVVAGSRQHPGPRGSRERGQAGGGDRVRHQERCRDVEGPSGSTRGEGDQSHSDPRRRPTVHPGHNRAAAVTKPVEIHAELFESIIPEERSRNFRPSVRCVAGSISRWSGEGSSRAGRRQRRRSPRER